MDKIKMIALMLTILIVFFGCDRRENISLSYGDSSFGCEIVWMLDGVKLRAVMNMGGPKNDGSARDVSLSFIEPQGLVGVTAERICGETSVRSGEMVISGDHIEGMLRVCDLFNTDGDIEEAYETLVDGERVYSVTLKRNNGSSVQIYTSVADGRPVKLSGRLGGQDVQVKVINFNVGG